jgi:hypothetical protein
MSSTRNNLGLAWVSLMIFFIFFMAFDKCVISSHVCLFFSYPCQWMKYYNQLFDIFKWKISSISYSYLPLISIGESGLGTFLGIVDAWQGFIKKTWNTWWNFMKFKSSIERPLHWFSWWWWMDQVFGSPISLKVASFWYFVIKAKLGLWPWSLVVMCDVHQHSPCIIFNIF